MFRLSRLIVQFLGGGVIMKIWMLILSNFFQKKDNQNAKSIDITVPVKFDRIDSLYLLGITVWTAYCPLLIYGTYTTVPHFNQANPKWSSSSW